MRLTFVPLASAALPFLAIHACYLLAASLGHVPWCIPYLDSCTSISAAARGSPQIHLFRALMMPAAVLFAAYWWLSYTWLRAQGAHAPVFTRGMLVLGVVASLGLLLYTAVLGEIGEAYQAQRRLGVMLFFTLGFLAQFSLTAQLAGVARRRRNASLGKVGNALFAICLVILALAVASVLLSIFYAGYDRLEDSFEWVFSLLMVAHLFTTHFAWKATGFQATFTAEGAG